MERSGPENRMSISGARLEKNTMEREREVA